MYSEHIQRKFWHGQGEWDLQRWKGVPRMVYYTSLTQQQELSSWTLGDINPRRGSTADQPPFPEPGSRMHILLSHTSLQLSRKTLLCWTHLNSLTWVMNSSGAVTYQTMPSLNTSENEGGFWGPQQHLKTATFLPPHLPGCSSLHGFSQAQSFGAQNKIWKDKIAFQWVASESKHSYYYL